MKADSVLVRLEKLGVSRESEPRDLIRGDGVVVEQIVRDTRGQSPKYFTERLERLMLMV